MEIKPIVSNITIYPVKSLDGIDLQKAQIGMGGCLLHDREYAIHDSNGNFVIGKTNVLVHALRSKVDFEKDIIAFRHESAVTWHQFHLQQEKPAIDDYLSDFFNMKVTLKKNSEGRFMDMPDIAGLTILSRASLEAIAVWYNKMDKEETKKRFRATIEIDGVPAFWEDKLFFEDGTAIEFTIGDVTVLGISPRERCVVPTRHPETGTVLHAFPKSFAKQRAAALPPWSTLEDYGHYYYLTVNCYIPPTEFGKWVEVGDTVKVIGKKTIQ